MSNAQQSEFWNGDAGHKWVTQSTHLDAMLLPFANQVIATANITPTEDILDIGSGGGALSLMASHLGNSVLGVDISKPLIDLANERSRMIDSVSYEHCDAAQLSLVKKRDVVISRFGVMFFSDPVSAFSNIRNNLKADGRMIFVCWQSPMKNLWAKAPLEAAMPFFKEPPMAQSPGEPGPFAFADSEYLTSILKDAGWKTVELKEWTDDIRLPGQNVDETASFMMEMGPLTKIIKDQDLSEQAVKTALIDKLNPIINGDGTVDMQASVWIVKASLE